MGLEPGSPGFDSGAISYESWNAVFDLLNLIFFSLCKIIAAIIITVNLLGFCLPETTGIIFSRC